MCRRRDQTETTSKNGKFHVQIEKVKNRVFRFRLDARERVSCESTIFQKLIIAPGPITVNYYIFRAQSYSISDDKGIRRAIFFLRLSAIRPPALRWFER